MATLNQNPEQIARDRIDAMLAQAGWVVQHAKQVNLAASLGVAVREYQTDEGPADYVLFIDWKPVGIIETTDEDKVHRLSGVADLLNCYAKGHDHLFNLSARSKATLPRVNRLTALQCARWTGGMHKLFGYERYRLMIELNDALGA